MYNLLRKLKYISMIGVFLTYWFITTLFTLPENYINISLLKEYKIFQVLLFQKWGFFAPPPRYSDRLYYTYINKEENHFVSYEVTEILSKSKREAFPFNSGEEILDYIIGNSISMMNDLNYRINQEYKIHKELYQEEYTKNDNVDSLRRQVIELDNSYQTLISYGIFLKNKYNLEDSYQHMVMSLGQKTTPKFVNRYEEGKEVITFISDTIKIR